MDDAAYSSEEKLEAPAAREPSRHAPFSTDSAAVRQERSRPEGERRRLPAPLPAPPHHGPADRAASFEKRLSAALRAFGVTREDIQGGSGLAARDGVGLATALTKAGLVSPVLLARATARALRLTHLRAGDLRFDVQRMTRSLRRTFHLGDLIPLRQNTATDLRFASVNTTSRMLTIDRLQHPASHMTGPRLTGIGIADRRTLIDSVMAQLGKRLAVLAARLVQRQQPDMSAETGPARWQMRAMATVLITMLAALIVMPGIAGTVVAILSALFFLAHAVLRSAALLCTIRPPPAPAPPTDEGLLPRYSVFIPLHREAHLLPAIRQSIGALDYPRDRLEVLLLLEEHDCQTVEQARGMRWPAHVHIIVVPEQKPVTKPKALNVALAFATGDLICIYDAEDHPDPQQLRKAAARFKQLPADVAVVQSRLEFHNADENWLARQFAVEYATHFGALLPAFEAMGLAIPLGGTSNHFKARVLRKAGGWDAFNVTEDADLGIRLARMGYRCAMLDSHTTEEATRHLGNWIRQRTRWAKGWILTYMVHMRRPRVLHRALGARAFWGFQLWAAGMILAPAAHVLFGASLVLTSGLHLATGMPVMLPEGPVLVLLGISLVAGYVSAICLAAAALVKGGRDELLPSLWGLPVYWLLIGAATLRAMAQALRDPFTWEKTAHGMSGIPRDVGGKPGCG
ncbi:MAG: glycosyltransferase [Pseudomonadota bacterium]